ncbi:MAG: hypothetical protein NT169_24900 [Chloroflexi bacterium]|nr:hypothetical protein [Chloroflexota bacterium]
MSEPIAFLEALVAALQRAGSYNKNDQCPPAAILWPDKERQWEPLLPVLRERLPLLTLGSYAPTQRTGPAYWLRCMIARTLPYDIYVRWKPLQQQPIGWAPDLNDGVRLNIRPFVTAGVLRSRFTINWKVDRGTNPDGSARVNDRHLTRSEKQAVRRSYP